MKATLMILQSRRNHPITADDKFLSKFIKSQLIQLAFLLKPTFFKIIDFIILPEKQLWIHSKD